MFRVLFVVFILVLFAGVNLAHNWTYFANYCYHAYDLGIYMEAVKKFGFHSLNPFLETFQQKFLNDHWHPGLVLAKIPTIFLPLSLSLIMTEIFFCLGAGLIMLWLEKKQIVSRGMGLLLFVFLLINDSILEATLAFPVHPAVWANFFLLGLVAIIARKKSLNLGVLLVVLTCLPQFGEQFSLACLGFSLAYLFIDRKKGFILTLYSLLWTWFTLDGRELILGPISRQTSQVSFDLVTVFHKYAWDFNQARNFFTFLFTMAPLIWLAWRNRTLLRWDRQLLLVCGIFMPLLLGRILSNAFGFQYNPILVAFAASCCVVILRDVEVSRRFILVSTLFVFLMSYSKFERAYNVASLKLLSRCVYDEAVSKLSRRAELDRAIDVIRSQGADKSILALGNLVPSLVEKLDNNVIVHFGGQSAKGSANFDFLLFEHRGCGDSWPYSSEKLDGYVDRLSKMPQLKTVIHKPCLSLFEGPISNRDLPRIEDIK